jgi:hypothetical protein
MVSRTTPGTAQRIAPGREGLFNPIKSMPLTLKSRGVEKRLPMFGEMFGEIFGETLVK